MKTLPIRAAMKAPSRGRLPWRSIAAAVPTSTGAIAAGSVRGRAAISQIRKSGPLRVLGEVRAAALLVRVSPLLALLRHVEEERRVVGELLNPGEAVLGGVEARLQEPEGEGGERRHLPAPADRLALELVHGDHRVHQAHLERLLGVVEATQKPDLLGLLDPDVAGEQGRSEAAVEASDARAGLPEDGVVGGDRQIADEVEDVPAADGVPGDHRHHRLRQPADLDVEIADVEAADALLRDLVVADVAVVAADPLVAAGAERLGAGTGEDDRGDVDVVSGPGEGIA